MSNPNPSAQAPGASLYPLSYLPSPQNIHSRGINLSTVREPIGRLGREDFSREQWAVQEKARAVVSPHWPALTSFTLDSSCHCFCGQHRSIEDAFFQGAPLVHHKPRDLTGQADLTCQHQGSHTFCSALHGRFHEGCEAEYVPPL